MNYKKLKKFEENRQKLMAQHANSGIIVDIGYANMPNPFLQGEVIGVDLYAGFIPKNYTRVIQADAHQLPFDDESIDSVLAGELVEHLMQPIQFFLECNRVLKEEGKLIFSVPNPYHPSDIYKNIFLKTHELFNCSHLITPSFRIIFKLLSLSGFEMNHCFGDYLRIPKIHLFIPMKRFPGIAYRNIYICIKKQSVDMTNLKEKMAKIYQIEANNAKSITEHSR